MPYKDKAARTAYQKSYNKRHYEKNRDAAILAASERQKSNPEQACAASKKWRVNNRPADAAMRARRRSQQRSATPGWAKPEKIAAIYILAADLGMEVDHVIPLRGVNVCGLHVETNLQLLTRADNIKKGNRMPLEVI